jgi:hypothetical protein
VALLAMRQLPSELACRPDRRTLSERTAYAVDGTEKDAPVARILRITA